MKKGPSLLFVLLFFLASLCVSALPCFAGMQRGFITGLYVRASDGLVYFFMSGTPTDRPSCARALNYWIIRDENSNAGKQQLAQMLAAYASGRTLVVYGADTCTRWPDGEDVEAIKLE